MVDKILKVGDWIQNKIKTKGGVLVLGVILGALPGSTISYIFYKNTEYKDERIISQFDRYKKLEQDKDIWQERAFNAEKECLKKIKEMASFFQDLESLYVDNSENIKEKIDNDKSQINQYNNITEQLNGLKNELKDEN